jgi:hypothetical protein
MTYFVAYFPELIAKQREDAEMESQKELEVTGNENQDTVSDMTPAPACAVNSDKQNLHGCNADPDTNLTNEDEGKFAPVVSPAPLTIGSAVEREHESSDGCTNELVSSDGGKEEAAAMDTGNSENSAFDDRPSVKVKEESFSNSAEILAIETSDIKLCQEVTDDSSKHTVDQSASFIDCNATESVDSNIETETESVIRNNPSSIRENGKDSFPAWNGNRSAPSEQLATVSESGLLHELLVACRVSGFFAS